MKKRILMAFVLLAAMVLVLTGCGEKEPLKFMDNPNSKRSAVVGTTKKCEELEEVFIPPFHNDMEVTSIDNNAFTKNMSLKRIGIPSTVTHIEPNAFFCSSVEELIIPASVERLWIESFQACSNLRTLVILSPITEFHGVEGCDNLTAVQLPGTVERIYKLGEGKMDNLQDIYFCGTTEQWMRINLYDVSLRDLTVHCLDGTMVYDCGIFDSFAEFDGASWEYDTILPDFYWRNLEQEGDAWASAPAAPAKTEPAMEYEGPAYPETEEPAYSDGFVPDYAPGMENTMSYHYAPRHGYYDYYTYSTFRRQDQTLYFMTRNSLYKMPLGGTANDIQLIYAGSEEELGRVLDFQVVGNWVYVMATYKTDFHRLYRIRTDGSVMEQITNQIPATMSSAGVYSGNEYNTFVVKNDDVYFTTLEKEQLSASESIFHTNFICYNTATGSTQVIAAMDVDNDNNAYAIVAYTDETILVENRNEEDMLMLYSLVDGSFTWAPEDMQEWRDCEFYRAGPNSFAGYLSRKDMVLRFDGDNGFAAEPWIDHLNPEDITIIQMTKNNLIFLDDMIISTYSGTGPRGMEDGLQFVQDGVHTIINGDHPSEISYPGDGYLYYSIGSLRSYHLYRVHLDGTGWEELNW